MLDVLVGTNEINHIWDPNPGPLEQMHQPTAVPGLVVGTVHGNKVILLNFIVVKLTLISPIDKRTSISELTN